MLRVDEGDINIVSTCTLAIGPYTNPKTGEHTSYTHRQVNKTYKTTKQTDKGKTTTTTTTGKAFTTR